MGAETPPEDYQLAELQREMDWWYRVKEQAESQYVEASRKWLDASARLEAYLRAMPSTD